MRLGPVKSVGLLACLFILLFVATQLHFELLLARSGGTLARAVWLALAIASWVVGTVLACRLVQLLVWSQVGRTSGRAAPKLLVQIANLIIYFTSSLMMAATLFDFSLTGAIATSSVIAVVVGFAVKSLISDTFSGIALNLDRGFAVNDFVQIVNGMNATRLLGRVIEINWRSTHLLTPENSIMVIPNTLMSESIVLNLSKPSTTGEFEMVVALDFGVAADRALRVLTAAIEAAARDTPAITDGKARISEASPNGVNYKIKYMLDPARLGPSKAKNLILGHLLHHLSMSGLEWALPKVDNWNRELSEVTNLLGHVPDRVRLLKQVDLFKGLEDSDLTDLAERMSERHYAAGSKVFDAGEPGRSMFVVSEGLVSVRLLAEDREIDVALLCPGQFFGEMSLLTGEPRSASIVAVTDSLVFEIDRSDLEPLLISSPSAARVLSFAAAERRLASDTARSTKPAAAVATERSSLADGILASMSRFLGLKVKKTATEKADQ